MATVNGELRAKDVMTATPVCVGPSATIRELARVFEEHEISGVPVIDVEGRVIGVVSKTDLMRRCSAGSNDIPPAYLFDVLRVRELDEAERSEVIPEPLVCVEDFMTAVPLTVGPEHLVAAVAGLMFEKCVHRVIVVDHERFPLGIITSLDLLGAFPASSPVG